MLKRMRGAQRYNPKRRSKAMWVELILRAIIDGQALHFCGISRGDLSRSFRRSRSTISTAISRTELFEYIMDTDHGIVIRPEMVKRLNIAGYNTPTIVLFRSEDLDKLTELINVYRLTPQEVLAAVQAQVDKKWGGSNVQLESTRESDS